MSSPGSDETRNEPGEAPMWHPAREWLEDDEGDEDDLDYTVPSTTMETEDDWEEDDDVGEERMGLGISDVPAAQLFELLASSGLQHILRSNGWSTNIVGDDGDDESDDEFDAPFTRRPRPRRTGSADHFPKVPNDKGTELMGGGQFGTNPYFVDRLKKRKGVFATNLMWRELGTESYGLRRRAGQSLSQVKWTLIPLSITPKHETWADGMTYSGQFSDDGNFFFACAQDFKVRMYDTSNPYEWKYYKTVDYPFGQWTITDATLSPDNRFLVYSSIRSQAYLATTDPEDDSDPSVLDFSLPPGQRQRRSLGSSHFGIWSLRFSGDGREVVAGTSENSVVVYDVETKQPVLNLQNRHQDHVNAVCYGDTSSPHLLYSGSDDTTLRVWDRRSMADGREAGAFMGHTEGLTYVDSKGDGRYIISNGKDQTMKLWDLRKMMTTADFDRIDPSDYTTGFDYRFEPYPDEYYEPHKHDCSVVTFRGHRVLKTLIRCHFSPPGSTNSRYVYTGSEDGKVYVYNMDATLAGTIDVGSATMNSRPREPDVFASAYEMSGEMLWRTCVRDASWHPNAPVLAEIATSWNGWGLSSGTCTVHSWNNGAKDDEGDPPIGKSYDDKLRYVPEFNHYREHAPPPRRRPLRSRPVRRRFIDEDETW
ncbi:hypothetical protein N7481_012399 [Penicillium waksmanii]|uniref:uncharacterized protein n=1 Tax=Penicillium waksmanii TaxID=69791 RepID=UPI0025483669|nr:uncharacterized protein N7481_012399 [Penicillium waksmanii]KAJ5965685.1 hypothetical protein N7481_012399 [Penicillium waksmanii]